MPTAKPKQPPIKKAATPTQQNANPNLNPQAKLPYTLHLLYIFEALVFITITS
jgi:hypothetical protein